MRLTRIALFISFVLFAFAAGGAMLRRTSPERLEVYRQAQTFSAVLSEIASRYVDSLTAGQLYDLAIDGMFDRLGDPYSTLLRADDLEEFAATTTGTYTGIGLRVESSGGWITVVSPLTGSPADSAGVMPGDRIVAVDGASIQGWPTDRAVGLLRGEVGTDVEIGVIRAGVPAVLAFELRRAEIHVDAVTHTQLLGDRVGYVILETVSEGSSDELREAIDGLRDDGATKLILDLRANPGGLLNEGIAIADLFLEPGDVVVETRDRIANRSAGTAGRVRYESLEIERWSDMPVVVLVNEYSASAAEIIAGALQDHDRALVVGSPTFGKGLVQSVFPLSRNQVLKLTTGRWYTPIGRSIQRGTAHVDTTGGDREGVRMGQTAYQSEGGRPLRGGGGIYPDLLIETGPTNVERRLTRYLREDVRTLTDVLSAYALDLGDGQVEENERVTVSAEMRDELRRRLRLRGVEIPDALWRDARDVVDSQLALRVLRFAVGRNAEMRRRIETDPVVAEATRLLDEAGSTAGLFRLVDDQVLVGPADSGRS